MKICTDQAGHVAGELNRSGLLDEPVLAAGHLRQGKAPSIVSMFTGWVVVQLLVNRLRKSDKLPGHFALAVTKSEVVAFKCWGGSGEDSSSPYYLRITEEPYARYPRADVRAEDIADAGFRSRNATVVIGDERIRCTLSNMNLDPNTELLLDVLSGEVHPTEPPVDEGAPHVEREGIGILDVLPLAI